MKKIILITLIVLIVVFGPIVYLANHKEKPCSSCNKNANTKNSQEIKFADYFRDETDFCKILTKEDVSTLLGKTVIKTNPVTTNTVHSCQYYLRDNQAVIVNYDTLNVEKQKTGHEFLDRKIITNPKIIMKHFLVIQESGLINEIYLVLGENEYVSINRTSGKTISEEEMVNFAAKLSEIVSGIVPLSTPNTSGQTPSKIVPLPQEKDIVQNFFSLIGEKKASDAVMMMTSKIVNDDSTKQSYGVMFAAMKSVAVKKIEESSKSDWTDTWHQYMITFDVVMNPDSATGPIPYYGYDSGNNIRFINLIKENNVWKIVGLATGP